MTLISCVRNAGHYVLRNNRISIKFSKKIFSGLCSYCGKLFYTIISQQTTCSRFCGHVRNGKYFPCDNCGKFTWRNKYKVKTYKIRCCSKKCFYVFHRGENHANYKASGFVDKKGYRVITVDGKQIFHHRYVMENNLCRPLFAEEIVHHVNGDKLDNVIENLEIMSR